MEKKVALRTLIESYEQGQLAFTDLKRAIQDLTGKEVSMELIRNYWTYTSLDELCDTLLIEPITDWRDIDDTRALQLLDELINNVTVNAIVQRNCEALTLRYRKTDGYLHDLIFQKGKDDPHELLAELKKDTTFYL